MSVDINMDDAAYVRGDAVAHQGLYKIPPHASTINETITTANATNPRIDQVVLEVLDNQHDASGSNLARVRVIAGTASAGATLDNRTGAAALPSSALLLADVLVAANDTSISDSEIRDRRSFSVPGAIPSPGTDIDMVGLQPHPSIPLEHNAPSYGALAPVASGNDLQQGAYLAFLPRRIVSATRIRWQYRQDGTTALAGNYVIGIYDASGRKVIDTGSVALTGATSSLQARSETITATTFEPGWYYVLFGLDSTAGNSINFHGVNFRASCDRVSGPNLAFRSASGGVTAPTTILGFTDYWGADIAQIGVPVVSLSVG
jgi:hypothetical protein